MPVAGQPLPHDIVIAVKSAEGFTLGVCSGRPQVTCRTFEDALVRAGRFASRRGVQLWFTPNGRDFKQLADSTVLRRLWSEYIEMPGLRLTSGQIRRQWSLDEGTCGELLDTLVTAGLLVRAPDGQYARNFNRGASRPRRMAKAGTHRQSGSVFRQAG